MPNELRDRGALDNVCLSSGTVPPAFCHSPEFLRAMWTIEQTAKDRKLNRERLLQTMHDGTASSVRIRQMVEFQRRHAPSKTMSICNTTPIAVLNRHMDDPNITIKVNQYSSSVSGLNRCKNPYCPMCSRSRAGERAHRIKTGILGAFDRGHRVFFPTFTIPRQGSISVAREEIRRRWSRMNDLFQKWRGEGLTVEYVRALDVTFNPRVKSHRYHLHIHAVVVVGGADCLGDSDKVSEFLIHQMQAKWLASNTPKCRALRKCQHIQEIRDVADSTSKVSKYVAKMAGLALEVANNTDKTETKRAHPVSLYPLMTEPKRVHIAVYREFLEGMRGVNTLRFTRGWDALSTEEEEDELETFEFTVTPDQWGTLRHVVFEVSEFLQFEVFQNSLINNYDGRADLDYERIQTIEDQWILLQCSNPTVKDYLDWMHDPPF